MNNNQFKKLFVLIVLVVVSVFGFLLISTEQANAYTETNCYWSTQVIGTTCQETSCPGAKWWEYDAETCETCTDIEADVQVCEYRTVVEEERKGDEDTSSSKHGILGYASDKTKSADFKVTWKTGKSVSYVDCSNVDVGCQGYQLEGPQLLFGKVWGDDPNAQYETGIYTKTEKKDCAWWGASCDTSVEYTPIGGVRTTSGGGGDDGGDDDEGCDDCGSCGDSRYRWCTGGEYGGGECVDFECECRPDLCNGGGVQCGNGKVESGEECDDGNTNAGDGCSSTCQKEGGGGGGGPTCGSPSWQGWSIDACWDENGIANCDKTSDVAEWICQNLYNQPVVKDYSATWLGGGTIYVPTGRTCPFCSFLFTDICCSPPPPTVNLSAPSIVEVPNAIVLTWSSSNADSCSASGDWSGGKSTSGSQTIKSKTTTADRGTYNFTLSCSGSGGSASDSVSVKVIQVPYCIFTADPNIIILPQLSTLTWECVYADSCEIDQQGIGSVNPIAAFLNVRPKETTTYTLDCQGLDGSRQFQADVGVGFIPVWREVLPR